MIDKLVRSILPFVAVASVLTVVPDAHAQGKWETAPPMPRAMGEVVGVTVQRSIFVFGGLNDAAGEVPFGAAYQYDVDTEHWTALQDMPEPAHHLMATSSGGKVFIFGGFTLGEQPKMSWKPTNAAWEYDPSTKKWTKLAPLPRPRGAGYAVTVGNEIYVIGGVSSSTDGRSSSPIPLASPGGQTVTGWVDEYDPATNTWRPRTSMPTPRNHYLASVVDGKIYALNGRTGSVFVNMSSITDLVEMYDPAKDSWTLVGRAPTDRGDVNGASYHGRVYVTGGEYETSKAKLTYWAFEAFEPASNTWITLPHVQITRHGFAAAFVDNKLHVIGGSFQSDGMPGIYSPTATHEVYTVSDVK
jgi:N-acetylneuraminic acid mutarotase